MKFKSLLGIFCILFTCSMIHAEELTLEAANDGKGGGRGGGILRLFAQYPLTATIDDNILNIEFQTVDENVIISIYDKKRAVVNRYNIDSSVGVMTIDVSNLQKGAYEVYIDYTDQELAFKTSFIKE